MMVSKHSDSAEYSTRLQTQSKDSLATKSKLEGESTTRSNFASKLPISAFKKWKQKAHKESASKLVDIETGSQDSLNAQIQKV